MRERYLANNNLAPLIGEGITPYHTARMLDALDPFYPRFWGDKLMEPCKGNRKGKGIFVCSMSDLFGIGIPEAWTKQILNVIKITPENRYYLLTKQPQNLINFSIPSNCWVGVTATTEPMMINAIKNLKTISAKVKYLSFEPLLNPLMYPIDSMYIEDAGIKWVIIGAQTKPNVMPKIEWVKEIVEAADKAGVAVFLKDSLKPLLPNAIPFYRTYFIDRTSRTEFKLRQDMPTGA